MTGNRTVGFAVVLFCALLPDAHSQLQIAPSSLTFKSQLVNTTSLTQAVTLSNTGKSTVTVNSITPSGAYASTSECSTLTAGAACTINVTFSPAVVGRTNGAITISSSARTAPQSVGLWGVAVAPLKLAPATLSFGAVAIGSASQPKSVTLTNKQRSAVTINAIATSGNYTQTNTCPASLTAGKSCVIHVSFQPTVAASAPGALSVSTNSTGPAPVALSGTGSGKAVSHVSLSPASLNFGDETVGQFSPTQTVTLTNTSTSSSLTIHSVTASGFGLYDLQDDRPQCTGMLAPGADCIIVVFFNPLANLILATDPGAVTIVDSDPTSPQVIGLTGNGTHEVTFNPASLTFAAQNVGTTSSAKTVTLTNTLQHPEGIFLSIFATGDYSWTGSGTAPCVNGAILLPSCTMTVAFTPTRTGKVSGAVTFDMYPLCEPETCAQPAVLNLTGEGK